VNVPELLQARGRLGRGLLADTEAAPELGDSRTIRADGLEREAVDRSRIRVAVGGQFGVQRIDHSAKRPRHAFDSEQLWSVQAGRVVVDVGSESCQLERGDTVSLAAGVERHIHAATDAQILVCGHGRAIASVPGEPTPRGTPAWIA
jgi:mannose-6-phosphate isomerase-like protein (cupin superfamily)